MAQALSTPCFEAARSALTALDTNVFSPLCSVEILAIPPRIVQIATNALGLVGSTVSGTALSGLCLLPLPEAFKNRAVVWKQDAWTLVQQLADKIGRLCIALIPFAGTKILGQNDSLQAQCRDLIRLADGLRADLDSKKALLAQAERNFSEEHTQVTILRFQLEKKEEELARQTSTLLDQVRSLEGRILQLTEELSNAQQAAVDEQQRAARRAAELEEARGVAVGRWGALSERLESREQEVTLLQCKVDSAEEQIEEAREETAAEQSKNQELVARLDTANQEIADLQQSRTHLQEQVASLTTELDQARADLEGAIQQAQPTPDAV